MGSEAALAPGASKTIFHVTGFGSFPGVPENPTEVMVRALPEYVANSTGLAPDCMLGSCHVLETAAKGNLTTILEVLRGPFQAGDSKPRGDEDVAGKSGTVEQEGEQPREESLLLRRRDHLGVGGGHSRGVHFQWLQKEGGTADDLGEDEARTLVGERIVWVHLGVNSGATKFLLERRAANEASFRCPDEHGWMPQKVKIRKDDGPLTFAHETAIPLEIVLKKLRSKGFDVAISDDAGRYVCNYLYYQSLCEVEQTKAWSLFVHVPAFEVVDRATQMEFIIALFTTLAAC